MTTHGRTPSMVQLACVRANNLSMHDIIACTLCIQNNELTFLENELTFLENVLRYCKILKFESEVLVKCCNCF